MKIAFTGHRPNKLGGYDNSTNKCKSVVNAIHDIVSKIEDPIIISGMALGVDTWAAQYAVSRQIPFYAYIPFLGQETMWPSESQRTYNTLCNMAAKVIYVCPAGYAAWKMQKRNQAMVDACDMLIAIWDGTSGGTGNCVTYAMTKGIPITKIDPRYLK